MPHPFGDLLRQFLHRKHGLSQAKLAEGILQPPAVITLMSKGQRLTSPQARERVVAIIGWLQQQQVLTTLTEANALLAAAGMANLDAGQPLEAALMASLLDVGPLHAPELAHFEPMPIRTQRTNLPHQLTRFIGRSAEREQLEQLLARNRLVTVTGAGGIGKTRLALEVAASMCDAYPHGVWLVELAPVSEPALLPSMLVTVLQLPNMPGHSLLETLIAALRARQLLLVLDNCEHLIEAAAHLVEQLLQHCPQLTVLATSREVLRVAGETIVRLPPLSIPQLPTTGMLSPAGGNDDAPITAAESVQLLLDRILKHQPDFRLTDMNALSIIQICRQLDGMPLAIELAAARITTLGVDQLAERLADQFRVLTSGSRTALPRHQTLRACLDWSYTLLTPPEQCLLRQLAVFVGSWTLEAAEAVCAGPDLEAADVLDLLAQLVDKSLVVVTEAGPVRRYRLLEPVRPYAQEQLRLATDEVDNLEERHCRWFVQLAEDTAPKLATPEQVSLMDQLELDHANFRAALAWCRIGADRTETGLRLACALSHFWSMRGHQREGRGWLTSLLALAPHAPTSLQACALQSAGELAAQQADLTQAQSLLNQALRLTQETGAQSEQMRVLLLLGQVEAQQSNASTALAYYQEALRVAHGMHDPLQLRAIIAAATQLVLRQGNYLVAQTFIEQNLASARQLGDTRGQAEALVLLGDIHQLRHGFVPNAFYEESLALYLELSDGAGSASVYSRLATEAYRVGNTQQALALYAKSMAWYERHGDKAGIAGLLRLRGDWAASQRQYTAAYAHYAQSLALYRDLHNTWAIATLYLALGDLALQHHDDTHAEEYYQRGLLLNRDLQNQVGTGIALLKLGQYALQVQQLETAEDRLRAYIQLSWNQGHLFGLAKGLVALVELEYAKKNPERAAMVAGCATALLSRIGVSTPEAIAPGFSKLLATIHTTLGDRQFTQLWAERACQSLEAALPAILAA